MKIEIDVAEFAAQLKAGKDGALNTEIASLVNISTDKVEYYHTLMKEYIDNKKYKELITGFSN
jgi:DNA-binding CsgD family transcriptional regulator